MTPRKASEAPTRIAPLPNLPLFHRIVGRKALVVGASDGARWKAELIAAAGADVTHLERHWTPANLEGAALAVADLADRDEALRFVAAAHSSGVPVNIIDQTDLCDVTFGTIVNRSPVVIGISTDGAAPVLGQSIRSRIESVLPLGLAEWARAAKAWRPALKRRVAEFAHRRRFWQRFALAAWADPDRTPVAADFEALLESAPEVPGSVTLVGAGPGDPELLTLKAVRALQSATVILYDELVGPEVLELARREARRIAVGKKGHGPSCSQRDINRQIVELAEAGETVVRLKGGDPLVFGRATEEIDACKVAGVPVSIVPGISAAQGAAAALGISLTERRWARRIQFVTGHGADGRLPADIDWGAIADKAATTVLYMPRRTFPEFVRKALAKGLNADTPAVAIASATLPTQTRSAAPLHSIVEAAAELPDGAPVLVIIGWIARDLVAPTAAIIPFEQALAS
ncbi:uroporphyrinogen-III C-methyltransferase [Sphingomonas ginkgonis]|uniref:Uroporphyrinogen-III C-methyltransferase n=1 Tax=Sphingomonas ginkgonis TaxID=2315330 RepID=A0A3R9WLV2_9SPHN|nr:siroheme synthase CysG [Sphingomonas ginkgonis]RST29488.1 uroporphyrinogen-III C-methyltransferase [Sphingomonas ginkgonis]